MNHEPGRTGYRNSGKRVEKVEKTIGERSR
jgi:hypothetical protein